MYHVCRHAKVIFSSQQMYDLVNDIESYSLFLPWCSKSNILNQYKDTLEAQLVIKKGMVSYDFVTKNTMKSAESIHISLVQGPFSHLHGLWQFETISTGCKISLTLNFELSNPILKIAIGSFFSNAMDTIVEAFCNRARQLHQYKREIK